MSKVVLHDYWGNGSTSVSYLELSPIISQYLREKGVIDTEQFVIIQHMEISPKMAVDMDYDIHYVMVVEED